jgi:hypothetical protein
MAPRQKLVQTNLADVKLAGVIIERVKEANLLGITIDDALLWNVQIKNVCNKIARGNGILSLVKGVVPTYLLRIMYYSFVYPYLVYGISVWGAVSASKLERIHILQKRSVRIIANVSFYAHTLPLFKKYEILKIAQLFQHSVCLYMQRIVHPIESNSFYSNLIHVRAFRENHSHDTRNNEMFILPKCRTDYGKLSITYNCIQNWNALPLLTKNEKNFKKFKIVTKDFFISKYK